MKALLLLLFTAFSSISFSQKATAFITAIASDSDGTITSYNWTKISGPNCTMANTTSPTAYVTFTEVGIYVFLCTVRDNSGASANATANITITPVVPPNKTPTVRVVKPSQTVPLKM